MRFNKPPRDEETQQLPCGKCLGCKKKYAQGWALRAHLEHQRHHSAAFTTLTYDEEHVPPTLNKAHLSKFVRAFRQHLNRQKPARFIRFFGCGEYGEQGARPHYHAIIYSATEHDAETIERLWGRGLTRTHRANAATIAYVAGYTAKKYGDPSVHERERIDYTTGEVYEWQPPFLQMSLKPGIGAHARQHTNSWRDYAITTNGNKTSVPRYYHQSWEELATEQDKEQLNFEQYTRALTRDTSKERLEAAEKIAYAKQQLTQNNRKLA